MGTIMIDIGLLADYNKISAKCLTDEVIIKALNITCARNSSTPMPLIM